MQYLIGNSIIFFFFFFSFVFSANDINELNNEDKKQCKKISRLINEIEKNQESNNKNEISKNQKKEISNYRIKYIDIYATNNLVLSESSSVYLLREKVGNGIFQTIGLSQFYKNFHSENFVNGIERYNTGFLINVTDYSLLFNEKHDFLHLEYLKIPDLSYVVYLKNKPDVDISYIEIKNCKVVKYYSKNKETKFSN